MKRSKKENKTTESPGIPRFKQGPGTDSWKLAVALVLALAIGVGGGILMNRAKQQAQLTDYQLGLDEEPASLSAQG